MYITISVGVATMVGVVITDTDGAVITVDIITLTGVLRMAGDGIILSGVMVLMSVFTEGITDTAGVAIMDMDIHTTDHITPEAMLIPTTEEDITGEPLLRLTDMRGLPHVLTEMKEHPAGIQDLHLVMDTVKVEDPLQPIEIVVIQTLHV